MLPVWPHQTHSLILSVETKHSHSKQCYLSVTIDEHGQRTDLIKIKLELEQRTKNVPLFKLTVQDSPIITINLSV